MRVLFLLVACYLLLVTPTFAQELESIEIGKSLIHPASPFYFLKTLRENTEEKFHFSDQARAIGQVEFAHRRIREVNSLISIKRQDLIEETLERYRHQVDLAYKKASSDAGLSTKVAEGLARQTDVLIRNYDQIGDQNGKRAIRASVIKIEEENQKVGKTEDLDLRQQKICDFLTRVSEDGSINEPEREILKQKANSCITSQ